MANRMANRMAKPMRTAWQNDAPNPNPNPNLSYVTFLSSVVETSIPNVTYVTREIWN